MIRFLLLMLWLTNWPLMAGGNPPSGEPHPGMRTSEALVLGVVEGVTEYLPVSSTGHLILASQAMGMGDEPAYREAVNTYLVVIQIGAILAVITVYGEYIRKMLLGLLNRDPEGKSLLGALIIAFLPAAAAGLLLDDLISGYLYGLWFVAAAWFAGGLALLKWTGREIEGDTGPQTPILVSPRQALIIGFMQVLAMWPGVSRSLVTIIGGRLAGLSLRHSVIFSFLLGMITLSAATAFKLLQSGAEMFASLGIPTILLGIVTAYFSAWIAVKTMVAYLKKHGLGIFGIYRILLAAITALLLSLGILNA